MKFLFNFYKQMDTASPPFVVSDPAVDSTCFLTLPHVPVYPTLFQT